ncbi:MAG: AAA family ATPase [Clostridia bacterium]|nr:AAA family ATPase [Clostridia bacterium]
MSEKKNRLAVIDGETLMDTRLEPTKFCIDTLLPQGITILGGAPKIGKSWWVLDICIRIAKGESVWGMQTTKGTTLYLCLEDTLRRVQERLCLITDDVPSNAFFATAAHTLAEGLCDEIRAFVKEHPYTVLVAIDTFQIVRNGGVDTSYGNDYDEIRQMKQLADELNISLLLVHHLRKQGDSDPLNKLSGTTGIVGAVDSVFVLDKSKRSENLATLVCTGRDIEHRQLELKFSNKDFVWEVKSDSREQPEKLLPPEMELLVRFMKEQDNFVGGNSEFVELFNRLTDSEVTVKGFKQMMNRWRYDLEELGVHYRDHRSNGTRLLEVKYIPSSAVGSDESAVSDETNLV